MRALLRADRADDELAKVLAQAGLYVERLEPGEARARVEELTSADVAVVDPRLLEDLPKRGAAGGKKASAGSLEALLYDQLNALLNRLQGDAPPALHGTVMGQAERALLRVVLERSEGLSSAAELLGIHRNTLSRRLEQLGLRTIPTRKRN